MARLLRTYPHDQINIFDHSHYSLDMAEPATGTRYLQVFTSDRGRDNTLLLFRTPKEFVEEYGIPVFSRHGQSFRQAFEILSNGGSVQCMRVSAKDSTHANALVLAKTKVLKDVPKTDSDGNPLYYNTAGEEVTSPTEEDGLTATTPITRDVFKIKYETKVIEDFRSREDIPTIMNGEYSDTADAEGYKTYPLFVIYSIGRGTFGNKFHFRFTPNLIGDRQRRHRTAMMEAFMNEGGLRSIEEPREVTLNHEALFYNVSEHIDQVVGDESISFRTKSSTVHYDALINELREVISEDQLPDSEVDIFFGLKLNGSKCEYIDVENYGDVFTSLEGIILEGGVDGEFKETNPTRQEAIDARLIEAFDGELDESIENTFSAPVDIALDANYSYEVKKALVGLKRRRNDFLLYLDMGLLPSSRAALRLRDYEFDYDDFTISLITESGEVFDDVSKKDILVTDTFNLASVIPRHDNTIGFHVPVAGITRGYIREFIEGTHRCEVKIPKVQDQMYDNQLNITDEYLGNRFYDMQLTSQRALSDLSHTNNVRILLELKKRIEIFAKERRYEFTEPRDIARFQNDVSTEIGREFMDRGWVRSLNINVGQTERQSRQKILVWTLDVRFKDFIIYNVINLNIR